MKKNSTTSSEKTDNIIQLIELKHSIYKEINILEEDIKRFKNRLKQIEKILFGLCNHEWEYDDYCGMYDKPDKVCRLCESRIIRF